jgi:hypothetical protein
MVIVSCLYFLFERKNIIKLFLGNAVKSKGIEAEGTKVHLARDVTKRSGYIFFLRTQKCKQTLSLCLFLAGFNVSHGNIRKKASDRWNGVIVLSALPSTNNK